MQPLLLEKLCGYKKGTSNADRVFAPSSYTPIYAEIVLAFKLGDNKYVAAVLPKVQLTQRHIRLTFFKHGSSYPLAGTGLNIAVQDGSDTIETPFYVDSNWTTAEALVFRQMTI